MRSFVEKKKIKYRYFDRAICTDDFGIVIGLLYLRGSSGCHRLLIRGGGGGGCSGSARKACVTRYVRIYIVPCRRVRQWPNQYFRVWRVIRTVCAGMARVPWISTKSSIVWKPSWITSSRWHSRVLRRSYFITSISPPAPFVSPISFQRYWPSRRVYLRGSYASRRSRSFEWYESMLRASIAREYP